MYKRIFFNPFYWYSFVWALVLVLYSFGWSELYEPLTDNLLVFFTVTIVLSFIIGLKYSKFISRQKAAFKRPTHVLPRVVLIAFGFAAEMAYEGHIPLLDELGNSEYTYMDFRGISSLHVIIITLSLFYAVYYFYAAINCKRKIKNKYFAAFVAINCCLVLLFNRGVIMMEIFMCAVAVLANVKKVRIYHIIITAVLAVLVLFAFGVLGNIRSGDSWNDTHYLADIAQINFRKYPSFLPKEFIWSYIYLISPLGNLNSYMITHSASFEMSGLLYCILPDALTKRLLPGMNGDIELVTPYLTVCSGFAPVYKFGGVFGLYFIYSYICAFTLIVSKLSENRFRSNSFIITNILLCTVVAFMFFNSTITYAGLTFALVYSLALVIDKPKDMALLQDRRLKFGKI